MQVPDSWLKNMVQLALILRGKYFFALPGRLYAASGREYCGCSLLINDISLMIDAHQFAHE